MAQYFTSVEMPLHKMLKEEDNLNRSLQIRPYVLPPFMRLCPNPAMSNTKSFLENRTGKDQSSKHTRVWVV
jgi:hypothetical protein